MKKSFLIICLLASLFLVACQQEKNKAEQTAGTSSSQVINNEKEEKSVMVSNNLISERYDVSYGDKTLYGMITAPENYKDKVLPVVVFSHGFNNTLEQFEEYAQFIAQQGYVVYRFDFYGGSRQSKSGGQDMLDMSVKTELEDLTQVIEQLSKENFVNEQEISLLGASQGGVVSTLYAAQHPEQVKKLMLIFPAFVLFDDVKETITGYGGMINLPDVVTHHNARLGKVYLTDAESIDIIEEQKKVTTQTLIIQGTEDTVVPYRYAEEASQTIPHAELVTVQGGGHWISDDFNTVALPAIENFLKG